MVSKELIVDPDAIDFDRVLADIHRLEPRVHDAEALDDLARAALHLLAGHVGVDALRALAQEALGDGGRDAGLVKDSGDESALALHDSHGCSSSGKRSTSRRGLFALRCARQTAVRA